MEFCKEKDFQLQLIYTMVCLLASERDGFFRATTLHNIAN